MKEENKMSHGYNSEASVENSLSNSAINNEASCKLFNQCRTYLANYII